VAAEIDREAAAGAALDHLIIHTGQHYTPAMSQALFDELAIPQPTINLAVGSGSHGEQTGRMLAELERAFLETRPDAVIVYGDTNSTLAGALAAVKLHLPVAHVEAGLRSGDRRMPEEINRIATDHVSDVLLAPTDSAVDTLAAEGLGHRIVWTGDIMYDAWLASRAVAARRVPDVLTRFAVEPGAFAIATIHRAVNTDERLPDVLEGLSRVAAHPRTAAAMAALPARRLDPRLRLIDPLPYLDLLALLESARLVLTDSGGLQKEAFFAGCPCVTLRDETEWVETVARGVNVLVGSDPDAIVAAVRDWDRARPAREALAGLAAECYGGGRAAVLTLEAVRRLDPGAAPGPGARTSVLIEVR
jgi:UDP-N-acetylglucosamine 2-epimerase